MLERRHPHPTNILNSYARAFLPILFCMVPFVLPDEETGEILLNFKWAILVFIGISAIVLLFLALKWKSTWIYTGEDTLYYESGVIAKKKRAIPFNKINTIDLRRNVFERIFGTARMKIDTGAIADNSEEKSEMALVFSVADCELIRSYILNGSKEENDMPQTETEPVSAEKEPEWSVKASFWDFFLYGLTDSSLVKILLVLLAGIGFIGELNANAYDWLADKAVNLFKTAEGYISGKSVMITVLIIFILFIIVIISSKIFSIAYAAIRYFGFRATRDGDNIVIKYGLISLKSYTLPVENIHACVINRNLTKQILKRASVEVVSVGYGNESNETALLFPIIRNDKLPEMLRKLLPEYDVSVERKGTVKKSGVMFILLPMLYWLVFCAAVLVGCSFIFENLILVSVVLGIITVIRLVSVVLDYRHSAVGIGKTAVAVEMGGMHYSSKIIKKDAIQSVTTKSGPIRRRLGLCDYGIDYHAPALKANAYVSSLPTEYINYIDIE